MDELGLLAQVYTDTHSGRAQELRVRFLLSRAVIAKNVGVSVSALGHWETGKRRPTGEAALRYARILQRLERRARALDRQQSTPDAVGNPRATEVATP
jgi:DNA-binding transcriptional regulator YiaG